MKDKLETRLAALNEEFEKGQTLLRNNEVERVQLEQSLMRIDGAMQVLRELLSENGSGPPDKDRAG